MEIRNLNIAKRIGGGKNIKLLLIWFFAISLTSCYQLDIELSGVPENTPQGSKLFVTGNFNKWNPGDSRYAFEMGKDSIYRVLLPTGFGRLEYKFTRGDWTTVETDQCGNYIDNRVYKKAESGLIIEHIECWKDMGPTNCPQITIVLDKLPPGTRNDDPIYLACNYNGWNAGDREYMFSFPNSHDERYILTLHEGRDDLVFKLTRGSWESVEVNQDGSEIENHFFSFGRSDTIYLEVDEWADLVDRTWMDITFVVQEFPVYTPPDDKLFLVGDFNGWNPYDVSLILDKNNDGTYSISIPGIHDYIEYKFTRGGWHTVEGNSRGKDIENRKLNTIPGDTIYVKIESWMDKGQGWR